MEIINFTYKGVNCYLITCNCGWVMVDAGWPDSYTHLLSLLRLKNIPAGDIKYLIITHFHPDHAGIAQKIKDLGAKLVLHECQISSIGKINEFFKKNRNFDFKYIDETKNIVVSSTESRSFFKDMGFEGEIIQTPGHSDDSISLVLDKYCAFTGDLPDYSFLEAFNDQIMNASWKLIKEYEVKEIYPAHGNPYTL